MHISYDLITQEWRAFDNVFIVAYPAEKQQNLMSVLGDYADATLLTASLPSMPQMRVIS